MTRKDRVAAARRRRMTRKVCRVCGKEFWSEGDGDICVKPSTCRVREHQARKAAEALNRQMMVDMDYYILYQEVIGKRPTVKESLDNCLTLHGVAAAKSTLGIVARMLRGEI